MAFVASTLWPKPLLNQNSRDMGAVYAGILFYSLVRHWPGLILCGQASCLCLDFCALTRVLSWILIATELCEAKKGSC